MGRSASEVDVIPVATAIVLAVLILATSVWVGGYVAIGVVAGAAAATLDPATKVAFFKALGRTYLWVGFPALLVALVTGAILLRDHVWNGLLVSTVIVAVVLIASLVMAVVQARAMTRLRQRALASDHDEHLADQVTRGGRSAALLRVGLGVLSIALVVLGSFLSIAAGN